MDDATLNQEARLHFVDYWRVIKSRWVLELIVFLVVVLVVAVVTYLQPNQYTATTRIKVEYERPSVAVFERLAYPTYDPFFLQTQYEIIQSKKILDEVIDRVAGGLEQHWKLPGKDLAYRRLKGELSVRRYRDTSLIEIAVTDPEPQLAADIANAIADVFERDRLVYRREETLKGITKLREELADQANRLQKAQANVERLRKELNVPVFGDVKLSDFTLQHLDQQLTQARVEAVGSKSKLDELKKLPPDQLRHTIATLINDPNVQSLLQGLTESELKMEVLKQDFGPDHPKVLAEQASLEKLREQINARLEGILRGIEVEYEVAQSRVVELQKQLEEAKTQSMALESDKYLPFRNAQDEAARERRLYEQLDERISKEAIELEVPRSPVEVIDRAERSLIPSRPRRTLNLALGVVAGLVLGVSLAFFIEFLDTSVKRIEDVERYLDLPVLGVVPQNTTLLAAGGAAPIHVEAYRVIRTNLEFSKPDPAINSYCILSAGPGEGKSFTTANLGCVYAQHGARVLLVDCDLRRPTLHRLFGLRQEDGVAEHLVEGRPLTELIVASPVPNVSVLPAGALGHGNGAVPLLSSQRMADLIQTLAQQFDVVLYDAPPALGVSDAAVLAHQVGHVLLVVQHRRYPRQMTRRARQIIEHSGGKPLGVVINNVAINQADTYFYYHHQYEDYLRAPDGATRGTTTPRPAAKSSSDEVKLTERY